MRFYVSRRACVFAVIFLAAQVSACTDPIPNRNSANSASDLGIHFVSYGQGEPVVLVHGFSQTHEAWHGIPLFDDLVRDHRIIAVDLRGHGNSDKPHVAQAYGPNLAADLVRLLDQLSIDKAHFVGFSLGASVVGSLIISNPERVQTATMGSGFFTQWDEREEEFAKFTEARQFRGEVDSWEPEHQDFKALAAVIRGAKYSSVSADQIASVSTPTLLVFGSTELTQMTALERQRIDTVPDSMKTLIIDGADHDSDKAAVLRPEFSQATRELIAANPLD